MFLIAGADCGCVDAHSVPVRRELGLCPGGFWCFRVKLCECIRAGEWWSPHVIRGVLNSVVLPSSGSIPPSLLVIPSALSAVVALELGWLDGIRNGL